MLSLDQGPVQSGPRVNPGPLRAARQSEGDGGERLMKSGEVGNEQGAKPTKSSDAVGEQG